MNWINVQNVNALNLCVQRSPIPMRSKDTKQKKGMSSPNKVSAASNGLESARHLKQSTTPQTLKTQSKRDSILPTSLSPNPQGSGPKIDIFSGGGLLSESSKTGWNHTLNFLGLGHKKKEEQSSEDDDDDDDDESTDNEIGDYDEPDVWNDKDKSRLTNGANTAVQNERPEIWI